MTNHQNIVITGFMGTGKTVVGRLVAEKINWPFIDTDEEIARRTGRKIADIFKQDGEVNFRHIERRMSRFLAAQQGLVVATGGGMLIDESNREVMLASGLVICLTATTEEIAKRLGADTTERPLLKGDWRALLESRLSAYDSIPHQIDTSNKQPEAVAGEIIALWQQTASV